MIVNVENWVNLAPRKVSWPVVGDAEKQKLLVVSGETDLTPTFDSHIIRLVGCRGSARDAAILP